MIRQWIKPLLLVPALYSCALAQDPVQLKYAELMTQESAKKHLTILASPEFEGRGTGQKGGEKAANYIAEEFKSYGLLPVVGESYFQPVHLLKTSYVVENFTINGQNLENGKDFFIQGDNQKADFNSDEIVFVGYGIQDPKHNDLKNLDIKGKVVLVINEGEPTDAQGNSVITGTSKKSEWSTSRFKRLQELTKLQPKLILATGSGVAQMIERFGARMTGGRYSLDLGEQENVGSANTPVVNIKEETANQILAAKQTTVEAQKQQPSSFTVKANLQASMGVAQEKLFDPNVLGLLEGSDLKDEIMVISGHYDHDGILPDGTFFPGADDNGSGTVGVMEIARAFAQAKKDGHGPRRSLLFIGLAAEEKGLLGSKFYVENPIFPLENTVACINLDMIGRIDDKHLNGNHNYIHAIGLDKLSSEMKAVAEKANDTYIQMELDYMYDDPNDPLRLYYRSDHYNFAEKGIPSAFFFSGLHRHYHTPEDTVDKIDFPMMVKREKLVFHTVWDIANRDKRLPVDSNKQ
ncbi:Peptidase family M28 [Sphingobacterium wenxiniae]|uniref:Peptidase family M28 n=2 Tax=Sphingobacterium wenxiniae TaxID=683125 RepID=A0A1I6TVT2_9SPHI|nr:Peptidase family M28 [Sphingobacterium wenxiniae]